MKKTLLAIALAAATTTAYADTSVSGHLNYSFGDLEDFNGNEDLDVADALTSQSRFRIKASKEAGGLTYGLTQEFGLFTGASNLSSTATAGSDQDQIGIRVNEFYVKGGFGKISVGQGSEAGDGKTESDFSGTYLGNGAAYNSWQGAGVSQIDGGRDERIRYDTPKLGPVSLAFDYDQADDFSAAISAKGSFWQVGAYFESREANDSDEVGGSLAFKFAGVTLALQAGVRDGATAADEDLEYTKTIIGYRTGAFSVAVDVGTNSRDDSAAAGDNEIDHTTTGLTFVYRPTGGVELWAGVRSTDDDDATASLANGEDSGDAVLLGGRVRF